MPGPDFGKAWGNQNCYWYAANNSGIPADPENPVSQNPGAWSGNEINSFAPAEIERAVLADGAVRASALGVPVMPGAGTRPGSYLMAAKSNAMNYHFARRDETTGRWYQKVPISSPAEIWPNSHLWIPHTGAWDPPQVPFVWTLHQWAGYYWVPDAGLPVQGWAWCWIL